MPADNRVVPIRALIAEFLRFVKSCVSVCAIFGEHLDALGVRDVHDHGLHALVGVADRLQYKPASARRQLAQLPLPAGHAPVTKSRRCNAAMAAQQATNE